MPAIGFQLDVRDFGTAYVAPSLSFPVPLGGTGKMWITAGGRYDTLNIPFQQKLNRLSP